MKNDGHSLRVTHKELITLNKKKVFVLVEISNSYAKSKWEQKNPGSRDIL
jgi:hypothetical protein